MPCPSLHCCQRLFQNYQVSKRRHTSNPCRRTTEGRRTLLTSFTIYSGHICISILDVLVHFVCFVSAFPGFESENCLSIAAPTYAMVSAPVPADSDSEENDAELQQVLQVRLIKSLINIPSYYSWRKCPS